MNPREDRTEAIDRESRRKYSGEKYNPQTIMKSATVKSGDDYFDLLTRRKVEILLPYVEGRRVLDLCCATGQTLFAIANRIAYGVGLDFSMPFLEASERERRASKYEHLRFACGNARQLPLRNESVDVVYSFASLYGIPRLGDTMREIGRVLVPKGIAVFDLGNLHSLNTLVCRAHKEIAPPCHVSLGTMRRAMSDAGLRIVEHRAFQMLPYWGSKPKALRPLLVPFWKRLAARTLRGRMLDEWIAKLPLARSLAFRHLFVCRKER
jgi:ubiquinone/menaquinone biosynthesis C-methylase UbiE